MEKLVKNQKMRLTAIDPGNAESAFITLRGGRIVRFGKVKNEELLIRLRLGEFASGPLFIEMIASYGMAVGREIFETCVWIGKFSEAYLGPKLDYVYRKEVAMHVCQSPRANDSNVRRALIDRFGGQAAAIGVKKSPGPLYGIKKDLWAALAVAITAAERDQYTLFKNPLTGEETRGLTF